MEQSCNYPGLAFAIGMVCAEHFDFIAMPTGSEMAGRWVSNGRRRRTSCGVRDVHTTTCPPVGLKQKSRAAAAAAAAAAATEVVVFLPFSLLLALFKQEPQLLVCGLMSLIPHTYTHTQRNLFLLPFLPCPTCPLSPFLALLTLSDRQELLDVDPEDRQLLAHALAVRRLQVPLQVDEQAVELLPQPLLVLGGRLRRDHVLLVGRKVLFSCGGVHGWGAWVGGRASWGWDETTTTTRRGAACPRSGSLNG